MIVAHVSGVPVEETVLQLAPAGAVVLSAAWVSARHALRRLRPSGRRRFSRRRPER